MSKWRQRGFVRDSDEEEEDLDIVSTSSLSQTNRDDCVASPSPPNFHSQSSEILGCPGNAEYSSGILAGRLESAVVRINPPTSSIAGHEQRHSESPDPIQCSPTLVCCQNEERTHRSDHTVLSNGIRLEYLPLSSPSDDDLPDPPPDSPREVIYASPKRLTQLHVVIPRSTWLSPCSQKQETERVFRKRKPIQLHPYGIEGERYRQEWRNRGLKPVRRPQSPSRKLACYDEETQDQEFDPENDSLANSPAPFLSSPPASPSSGVGEHRQAHSLLAKSDHRHHNKLYHRSTQAIAPWQDTRTPRPSAEDVWAIPQSPPQSGNPTTHGGRFTLRDLAKARVGFIIPEELTPSRSVGILNEHIANSESDLELDAERSHEKYGRPFQPIPLSSDDSSSDSNASGQDSEQGDSDADIQRVRKRIKGVLPASWLRIDKQAQERKKTQARERRNSATSPEKPDPQRGIAHRVLRLNPSLRKSCSPQHAYEDFVVISDDPDEEIDVLADNNTDEAQRFARVASEIAATYDRRYAETGEDDMENDRLHLFGSSGGIRKQKRKRQLKLTDAFLSAKKARASRTDQDIVDRTVQCNRQSRQKRPRTSRGKHSWPALSILDLDRDPSLRDRTLPQFIRLAMRLARRRPDRGRQSPHNKHIRLHTFADTEDAKRTLLDWRAGNLQPNYSSEQSQTHPKYRQPLLDKTNNQRWTKGSISNTLRDGDTHQDVQARATLLTLPGPFHQHISGALPKRDKLPQMKKSTRLPHAKAPSFRTSQLEGLESAFSNAYQKFVFEEALQRVDQQYSLAPMSIQQSANPQLARFLTDNGAVLPPLPLVKDISEHQDRPARKHRLVRKGQAERVDIGEREYRQPSEPTLQDVNLDIPVGELEAPRELVLKGLGPFGTHYSTNFDVSPLPMGTYFSSTTFVGSEQFRKCLETGQRDMDANGGHYTISLGNKKFNCGPWKDETFSLLSGIIGEVWAPLDDQTIPKGDSATVTTNVLQDTLHVLQSLSMYMATSLSFLDAVDRGDFVMRVGRLLESILDKVTELEISVDRRLIVRTLTYLLVMGMQVRQVAEHEAANLSKLPTLTKTITNTSKIIVKHLIRGGMKELGAFLERNKSHKVRENGIQEDDTLVECLVVCMHVLSAAAIPGSSFWDLTGRELSNGVDTMFHLRAFESVWVSVFTLLPFVEFDSSGILEVNRRSGLNHENWGFLRGLLKRLFELYPGTITTRSSSVNDYMRTTLTRCYILIRTWHWRKCDLVLSTMFDFFAKNGLQQLRFEEIRDSPELLDKFVEAPSTEVYAKESAFHIFLKCLALGLQEMQGIYPTKKITSIVQRCIPNHGRSYPKDEALERESLDALRNHHDLLCVLYWASPPACRPKIKILRDLVHHQNSHREACRLNVRAWSILTTFQVSQNESIESLKVFAEWHKDIMEQTLEQYRQAGAEAEEYLQMIQSEGTSDTSTRLVRSTVAENQRKNQGKVLATLRDCIGGMRSAIRRSTGKTFIKGFLVDSGIIELLELVHVEDARLTLVIRETLTIIRDEESQEYGSFPDLDDTEDPLDFIPTPLWHLLSNAFGTDRAPNEDFLIECVDTWTLIASHQVLSRVWSWAYFIGSFSPVSWHQLRDTEQSRKFSPYFMASLINRDPTAYTENQNEFLSALLVSLVERESMLRFQHWLLYNIIRIDAENPLLKNLPFYKDDRSDRFDITADTIRTRRLALISSILANMQEDLFSVHAGDAETKRTYASLLKDMMAAMKNNYQELGQGLTVTGAYVDFVHRVVQFLQQYASDICVVHAFFTDSVSFPLPATDPKYVVGRLRGYASKLSRPGITKRLSTFLETVAQQAAQDNLQPYLVNQLSTALSVSNLPSTEMSSLRATLLQGIFPAYIDVSFSSATEMLIAQPILQSLKSILASMLFDLRVADSDKVQSTLDILMTVVLAFIRATEHLVDNTALLQLPPVLRSLGLILEAMIAIIPVLDYINGRTSLCAAKPDLVIYFKELCVFVTQIILEQDPHKIPTFCGSREPPSSRYAGLLSSCSNELKASIKANWSEAQGRIYFGHGGGRREVVVGVGLLEEEQARLVSAMERFHETLAIVYNSEDGASFADVVV
ncbi:hypothetical protein CC78DRAFT_158987 [Lojkania enalia]|uniref:Mus7/MMS22 family-domain-containing protein n=1 Tax=Lojkania enalia TaxID=147567 RepID=A0A9P4JY39_9PLEO|nr:hypothetical protein CC78DRAFT_158987 [Didymosphaeria enalia]